MEIILNSYLPSVFDFAMYDALKSLSMKRILDAGLSRTMRYSPAISHYPDPAHDRMFADKSRCRPLTWPRRDRMSGSLEQWPWLSSSPPAEFLIGLLWEPETLLDTRKKDKNGTGTNAWDSRADGRMKASVINRETFPPHSRT